MTDNPSSSKDRFVNTVKESLQEEMSTATTSVEKGERFLVWAITRIVDAGKDEIEKQITDGPGDMGIDTWIKPQIASDNGGTIQLFQSKFGQSHDEKEILKFVKEVEKFLTCKLEDIPRDDMRQLRVMIDNEHLEPELYYITDQKIKLKYSSPKDIQKVKVIGFDQIVDKLWADIEGIPEDITETIQIEDCFERNDCLVGAISLKEFRKFVNRTQRYIYESNIRKYLQKTKINKGLRKTLENASDSVFQYNNGVTIVVKDYKKNGGEITLTEPQIDNGAQTSQTIYEVLPLITNATGEILVTVIRETSKAAKDSITQYRNSQNAVKGKDLITLSSYHKMIGAQLKQSVGYFYERQAGSWKFLENRGQADFGGHDVFKQYLPSVHENCIPAPVAIQAMVAGMFQDPTKPYSSQASFMPNGAKYPDIFNSQLPEDYRILLYPYLVKCYGEKLEYGSKQPAQDLKRYARLLFVSAYFKILFELILKKEASEVRKDPKLLDPIFKNFAVNEELLKLTDAALEFYFINAGMDFQDLNSQEGKVVTWHNFFSNASYAWNPKLTKTIMQYLAQNKPKLKSIQDKL